MITKIAYLLFKDAPHLKQKGEPDSMIAVTHALTEADSDYPAPFITTTPNLYALKCREMYQDPEFLEWQNAQPRLVEVDGKREERDANLKKAPALQQV